MSAYTKPKLYKAMSMVFLVSLVSSLFVGMVVPYLLAGRGDGVFNPPWVGIVSMILGLVAAATVPFAWRWAYRRRWPLLADSRR